MPYVERIVSAGSTVEHRKMQSSRVHTKGVKRQPNRATTTEKQAKVNERTAVERARWTINQNFGWRDLHVVLHYYEKGQTIEGFLQDGERFLRKLSRLCKKKGTKFKYFYVPETKRMTNPHHHVVLTRLDVETVAQAWEWTVGEGKGGISFQPLDRRGNHYKLAEYLMKESRSTMARYKEMGKRGQRYSTSRNMDKPKITYKQVAASSWRNEPKPHSGAVLYKFEDGATSRSGFHELSGYPYQEYFEVYDE